MLRTRILLAGAFSLSVATGANAAVYYNNLGAAPLGGDPTANDGPQYNSFIDTSQTVDTVQLLLSSSGARPGGIVMAAIYDDDGSGHPNGAVGPDQVLGFVNDSVPCRPLRLSSHLAGSETTLWVTCCAMVSPAAATASPATIGSGLALSISAPQVPRTYCLGVCHGCQRYRRCGRVQQLRWEHIPQRKWFAGHFAAVHNVRERQRIHRGVCRAGAVQLWPYRNGSGRSRLASLAFPVPLVTR